MTALVEDAIVCEFIRKLRGPSQASLVRGSDGERYVLKFSHDLSGRCLAFYEAAGTELYRSFDLPVPEWKILTITREFLKANPACGYQTGALYLQPPSGPCFGSRYLGADGAPLFEILPSSHFDQVGNRGDFWKALLVDIFTGRRAKRKAIFRMHIAHELRAVFINHAAMFADSNFSGVLNRDMLPKYPDERVYSEISAGTIDEFLSNADNLDVNKVWARVQALPKQWLSGTGLTQLSACLDLLSSRTKINRAVEQKASSFIQMAACADDQDRRQVDAFRTSVRSCIQSPIRACGES